VRSHILGTRAIRPPLIGVGQLTEADETQFSPEQGGTYHGFTNPNVTFVRGRFTWHSIQPANDSSFTWTGPDNLAAACAAYGKKYSFNVGAGLRWIDGSHGQGTPAWFFSKPGAVELTCHDSDESPSGTEPAPWDPVYQQYYFALIDAVAARYSKDPNFCLYWVTGFMQKGDMYFGSTLDESTNFLPSALAAGYLDVDSAYVAGATAVVDHTMNAFPQQNALVNFVRAFPTSTGQTVAVTVKDHITLGWPGRGGSGVSAIFALEDFGPPTKSTFPKGGQQVQPTFLDGATNPNCYKNPPGPPDPLPDAPDPFLQMGGEARALGNTFIETYDSDIANTLIQATFGSENDAYRAMLSL